MQPTEHQMCVCGTCAPTQGISDQQIQMLISVTHEHLQELKHKMNAHACSTYRIACVHKFVCSLEKHNDTFVAILPCTASGLQLHKVLLQCLNVIENLRVEMHCSMSSVSLIPDEGITEDVCCFLAVCCCEHLLQFSDVQSNKTANWSTSDSVIGMCCVPFADTPVRNMSAFEIDCSFSSLFEHSASIDWCNSKLHQYIAALQRRCAILLIDHISDSNKQIKNFEARRTQWSCASARLKMNVISETWLHTQTQEPTQCELQLSPQLNEAAKSIDPVSFNEFRSWLQSTIKKWDGARLREAVAKAYNKRTLRSDEAGRNCAFNGQTTLHRARGALECTEDILHSVELDQVAIIDSVFVNSKIVTLQDVIIMKVVHNCLEVIDVDFMEHHLCLDSQRETWRNTQFHKHAETQPIHIVECATGRFHTQGMNSRHKLLSTDKTSFTNVFLAWYNIHFKCADPLNMKSVHAI